MFRFFGAAVGLIEHTTNPISERILGAAIEVHRHLGPGLLESSYHTCLCRELELHGIAHQSQVALPLEYKGIQIARGYVIDLLIEDATYMRLQRVSSGLLINFNVHTLLHGTRRILR
jgi:PD-(D/E)XK nuclease superfamily